MHDKFFTTIYIIIAFLFGLIIFCSYEIIKNNKMLMRQCLSDGNKEYECAGMLRGSRRTIMPIVIPAG